MALSRGLGLQWRGQESSWRGWREEEYTKCEESGRAFKKFVEEQGQKPKADDGFYYGNYESSAACLRDSQILLGFCWDEARKGEAKGGERHVLQTTDGQEDL